MKVTNKRAAGLQQFLADHHAGTATAHEGCLDLLADRAEMLKKLQRAYWRMNEGEHNQGLLDEICTFLAAAEKE